jgi:hypothetical protein
MGGWSREKLDEQWNRPWCRRSRCVKVDLTERDVKANLTGVNGRPPRLSPPRLIAGLVLPWLAYLVVKALIGSSVGALAITDALPATWLLVVGIVRRRIDPVAVLSAATVFIALAAYAITGGDPVAIKLRRGAVTGAIGGAALISVALGRPLLLLVAQNAARANSDRPEFAAKLADPRRRRMLRMLTVIIGTTFTIDGVSQIALALSVPTSSFVADSTAARIAVLGSGAVITIQYLRDQRKRLDGPPRGTVGFGGDR